VHWFPKKWAWAGQTGAKWGEEVAADKDEADEEAEVELAVEAVDVWVAVELEEAGAGATTGMGAVWAVEAEDALVWVAAEVVLATAAEIVVVVVTVMVVLVAVTHFPAVRICPSRLEQVLQPTPPSL
jgi:hypothetical protein